MEDPMPVIFGYGEAKTEEAKNERYYLAKDLVRTCVFFKNPIDLNGMHSNIGFQAVGWRVVFYFNTRVSAGVYIAYEIAAINFPKSFENLAAYITTFNDHLKVMDVYDNQCGKSKEVVPVKVKRNTLDSPDFRNYVTKCTSKFNDCPLKL